MTKRIYLLLFLLGILVLLPVINLQSSPGYMDADYYYAGGVRLTQGYGFSELILWNYLDGPTGLPHPSHGYWMPLASLIAASGMYLANEISFSYAKLGFLLIAGLLPPITAALAYSIHTRREHAIYSGVLASFPVFYLAYLGTTDTFAVYMLLGAIWFILIGVLNKYENLKDECYFRYILMIFVFGITSGFLHFARADGILWLLLGLFSIGMIGWRRKRPIIFARRYLMPVFVFMLGYLVVMGPWMIRNLSEFGMPLAPGGIRVLWLIEYNDIYTFPASVLTFQRWWSIGFLNILSSKLYAISQNLQTFLAVQGGIILSPFIFFGMWRMRKDLRIQIGFIAWLATFLIMTFIFTEVGWRGGFFHSGAALQPLFWAMVPVGFEIVIEWGVRVRSWDMDRAQKGFGTFFFGVIVFLTAFLTWQRVIGKAYNDPVWNQTILKYTNLEEQLRIRGAKPEEIVLVNNAPGYFVANGRSALSIPNVAEESLIQMATLYDAKYLLLDKNYPEELRDLYINPHDRIGIDYLGITENTHIYSFGE